MELLIVTGMSGAGKSRTIDALEDIGFYCVDNMPPKLLSRLSEVFLSAGSRFERVAVVIDLRGGDLFYGLFEELDQMQKEGLGYKLLFLDAADGELMRRYKETRRRHPLADLTPGGLSEAIRNERTLLLPARSRADYVIDTTHLSSNQLRQRLTGLFLDNIKNAMLITIMSFGFKYGVPAEADLVFDVRCLPNPFYVDELKKRTGLEKPVQDYVMQAPESHELQKRLSELLEFLIPLYQKEGKTQLTVAVGCTGGQHRSVTIAERLYGHLSETEQNVRVSHRDISRS